jgi:hypothetical protein
MTLTPAEIIQFGQPDNPLSQEDQAIISNTQFGTPDIPVNDSTMGQYAYDPKTDQLEYVTGRDQAEYIQNRFNQGWVAPSADILRAKGVINRKTGESNIEVEKSVSISGRSEEERNADKILAEYDNDPFKALANGVPESVIQAAKFDLRGISPETGRSSKKWYEDLSEADKLIIKTSGIKGFEEVQEARQGKLEEENKKFFEENVEDPKAKGDWYAKDWADELSSAYGVSKSTLEKTFREEGMSGVRQILGAIEYENSQSVAESENQKQEFEKQNIKLDSGEWVSKSIFDKLSDTQKESLNKIGIDKFNEVTTAFERISADEEEEFKKNNIQDPVTEIWYPNSWIEDVHKGTLGISKEKLNQVFKKDGMSGINELLGISEASAKHFDSKDNGFNNLKEYQKLDIIQSAIQRGSENHSDIIKMQEIIRDAKAHGGKVSESKLSDLPDTAKKAIDRDYNTFIFAKTHDNPVLSIMPVTGTIISARERGFVSGWTIFSAATDLMIAVPLSKTVGVSRVMVKASDLAKAAKEAGVSNKTIRTINSYIKEHQMGLSIKEVKGETPRWSSGMQEAYEEYHARELAKLRSAKNAPKVIKMSEEDARKALAAEMQNYSLPKESNLSKIKELYENSPKIKEEYTPTPQIQKEIVKKPIKEKPLARFVEAEDVLKSAKLNKLQKEYDLAKFKEIMERVYEPTHGGIEKLGKSSVISGSLAKSIPVHGVKLDSETKIKSKSLLVPVEVSDVTPIGAVKALELVKSKTKTLTITKTVPKVKVNDLTLTKIKTVPETNTAIKVKTANLVKVAEVEKVKTVPKIKIETLTETKIIPKTKIETETKTKQRKFSLPNFKFPDGNDLQNAIGAIAWYSGKIGNQTVWYVVKYPYKQTSDVVRIIGNLPEGVADVKKGKGAAIRSIQTITGTPPKKLMVDLGIQDINIKYPMGKGSPGTILFTADPHQITKGDITIRKGSVKSIRMHNTQSGLKAIK